MKNEIDKKVDFGDFLIKQLIFSFRILYIKNQNWIKYRIGERWLLVLILVVGGILNVSVALIMVQHDHQSLLSKICNHYSEKNLQILEQYLVS